MAFSCSPWHARSRSPAGPFAATHRYLPSALLLTSHHPFADAFRTFLCQIYRLSRSSLPVPIERYVANFCAETPLPPRGRIRVRLALGDIAMELTRPALNAPPALDAQGVRLLFAALDIDHVRSTAAAARPAARAPVRGGRGGAPPRSHAPADPPCLSTAAVRRAGHPAFRATRYADADRPGSSRTDVSSGVAMRLRSRASPARA